MRQWSLMRSLWIPTQAGVSSEVFGARVTCIWLVVSHWMFNSNTINLDWKPLFHKERLFAWRSRMPFSSRRCVTLVCFISSSSNWNVPRPLSTWAEWCFSIQGPSSNFSISWWAATNTLLRLSWTGSAGSKSLTVVAKLVLRLQIVAN